MICYPIFDPAERQALRVPVGGWPEIPAPGIHRLQSDLIGPILGLVNVDAGWDYTRLGLPPSPEDHAGDRRILAVIDTVVQASMRLARLLVWATRAENAAC
jgi:hypothetical protein